jgi:hypothetical protein
MMLDPTDVGAEMHAGTQVAAEALHGAGVLLQGGSVHKQLPALFAIAVVVLPDLVPL